MNALTVKVKLVPGSRSSGVVKLVSRPVLEVVTESGESVLQKDTS